MSAVTTEFYKKKKKNTLLAALAFLFVILVLSGILYYLGYTLKKDNESLALREQELEKSISERKQEPNLKTYEMYEKNKILFQKSTNNSQISIFVNHLKKNLNKFLLRAEGFNYKDAQVTTKIISQTNDSGYAYEKVVRFLRNYQKDDKALFTLEKIEAFSGYDTIEFNITFRLKDIQ